jgi:ribosome-binding protein aMBF1 (putative translation factor)
MARKTRRQFKSKALHYAYDRYVRGDRERADSFEHELLNARVARKLYNLRTRAGLTQKELADRVDTTASVISRLEDADYEGHSLSMLRRVADAFDQKVEIRFVQK